MDNAEFDLASGCFGYGRWDAPYWFIGPEQGQDRSEGGSLTLRHRAFRELSRDGLSDCRDFHAFIEQRKWHFDARPPLQKTWRRLMLLMAASLSRPTDAESLRSSQRERWGSATGETCVIELSGLPATSFSITRDRETFRRKRIQFIQQKLSDCKPAFVVMYGKGHLQHWKEIATAVQPHDHVQVVFAPHPIAYGTTDKLWIEMGRKLQRPDVNGVGASAQ